MVQALRGSLLKKYAKIRAEIDKLHNSRMSPYEKVEAQEAIRSHIMGAWRTDEIRRTKPSPQVCVLHCLPLTAPKLMYPDLFTLSSCVYCIEKTLSSPA